MITRESEPDGTIPMDALPPLRIDIELIPANVGGRELLLVRDALGIVGPNTALLPEIVP